MRRAQAVPADLSGRLVTPAMAREYGVTLDRLATGAFRRVIRGVYCDARMEVTPELLLDAVELLCPGAVWLSDVAVLRWGLPQRLHAASTPRLHVLMPTPSHRRSPTKAFRVSVGKCLDEDVVVRAGRRVAGIPLLMSWLAEDWELADLVALADAAVRRRFATTAELQCYVGELGRRRGAVKAAAAVAMLDPGAASAMESRLRVAFLTAGLPKPVCGFMVTARGGADQDAISDTLGEVDFAWVKEQVAVEYDGADHATSKARSQDSSKRRLLERHGWTVIPVTAWDYFNRLDAVVGDVRAALAAAR